MSQLPQVLITDLITEPLDCERAVLDGHAEVRALNARILYDTTGITPANNAHNI